MDFTNILSQNNNEDTPNLINKSLPFSPLISSYTNKIYNTKYENFVYTFYFYYSNSVSLCPNVSHGVSIGTVANI